MRLLRAIKSMHIREVAWNSFFGGIPTPEKLGYWRLAKIAILTIVYRDIDRAYNNGLWRNGCSWDKY